MRTTLALIAAAAAAASPRPAASAPLTLDEALDLAARQNPDLAVARATRDAAAVDAYGSWSGVLPRLDLSGSFGEQWVARQDSVYTVPTFDGTGTLTGFAQEAVSIPATRYGANQLGLTLRWTIFDGLSSWRAIAAARSASRAADRSLDEASLQVSFLVTSRFYEVVKQERILKVREESAARSESLVKTADALYAAGRGTRADTFAARVNLGNDRIAVERQRAQLVRARSDLAVALGRETDPDLEVVPPAGLAGAGLPALAEPPPLEVLMARARQARPLLAARRGSIEAAEAQAAQARGAWWPVLGVLGSYSRQSSNLAGSRGVLGDLSYQYVALAQVTLTWNLFQGRQTLAAEQKADVQARRARVDAAQAEQLVSSEIARARTAVITLARSAALAQDALQSAEQGLKLARERLEAGAASQLEVRDATQKLAEAQLALTSSLVDHAVARADLNRAVGGSL